LDFKRFCSDMIIEFQQLQIDLIREYAANCFITHNFVIFAQEFDLYKASQWLDFVAWDSYPIGMLEFFATWESEQVKTQYARTGHPDLVSLNHDIYRGLKGGKDFWVMEQQCGQANWAEYNPLPADGAVKLWTAQAWAHGASAVIYFRWRASHYAQEIMHSGLLQQDGREDRGFKELMSFDVSQFALTKVKAKVALLHDYESLWLYEQQPHNQKLSYWAQFVQYYSCLRQMGVDVDIIHPSQLKDNKHYQLIVAPALCMISESHANIINQAALTTPIIFGPRTATRTDSGTVPIKGQFALLEKLVGIKLLNFDSLRPGLTQTIHGKLKSEKFVAQLWCESYELVSAQALYEYTDGPMQGRAAVTQHNNVTVIGVLCMELLKYILQINLSQQDVKTYTLPEGLRITHRGNKQLIQNFSQKSIHWQEHNIPAVSAIMLETTD
jgi:beta-galactosidase